MNSSIFTIYTSNYATMNTISLLYANAASRTPLADYSEYYQKLITKHLSNTSKIIETIPDSIFTVDFIKYLLSFDVFADNVDAQDKGDIAWRFGKLFDRTGITWIRDFIDSDVTFYHVAFKKNNMAMVRWIYHMGYGRILNRNIFDYQQNRSAYEAMLESNNPEFLKFNNQVRLLTGFWETAREYYDDEKHTLKETNPEMYRLLRQEASIG